MQPVARCLVSVNISRISPAWLLLHARTDPGRGSALEPRKIFLHSVWMWKSLQVLFLTISPDGGYVWLHIASLAPSQSVAVKFFPEEYRLYWCCSIFLPIHLLFSFLVGSGCLSWLLWVNSTYFWSNSTPDLVIFQDKCRSHRRLERCPCAELPNRTSINFSSCHQDLQHGSRTQCPTLSGHLAGDLGRHLGYRDLLTPALSMWEPIPESSMHTHTHTRGTKPLNSTNFLKSRGRMKGKQERQWGRQGHKQRESWAKPNVGAEKTSLQVWLWSISST